MFPPECRLRVLHLSDASKARRLVKDMARALGFDLKESEDLAIVVSELASNLVKYAKNGQLVLTPVMDKGRLGIKIVSLDDGPGFTDVEQAITDGFSTAGSLGYGLGTVNRLMDELDIQMKPDGKTGTLITCLRWKREYSQRWAACPLSFGIATRACLNSEFNGDAFVIEQWNKSALIGLLDGLGHGQHACNAARRAREYLKKHYDQPLQSLFCGVDRVCRATRGVVMALARFDYTGDSIRLTYGSIGNIETRILGSPGPMKLKVHRGVVGLGVPPSIIKEYDWNPAYILVMHTDGIDTLPRRDYLPKLLEVTASHAAQYLLEKLGREDDDATVIVVKQS